MKYNDNEIGVFVCVCVRVKRLKSVEVSCGMSVVRCQLELC